MNVIDHNSQTQEKWRDGVMTLMRISAINDSRQLCIFDQYCEAGLGAPIHLHAVEEVLDVIDGKAEITVGKDTAIISKNQSVIIPAGNWHGFTNAGSGVLHVRATLAACIFESSYEDRNEIGRRWVPDVLKCL